MTRIDEQYMQRALDLAERGLGKVEPNPMVGCVIIKDGRMVGEGFHQVYGEAHAEVHALRAAGAHAKGATVYVTLEPCSHYGKTPPCAKALIEAEVARVVCAMRDPFEQVAGRGIEMMREAGIEVEVGLMEKEARHLNRAWLKTVEQGMPWVISKWAQTVDGVIATQTGDSKWISNERCRKKVHELRGRLDGIIVGIGTVIADDPLLTARDVEIHRECCRVVIDPNLQLSEESQLVKSLDQAPLTVAIYQDHIDYPTSKVTAMEEHGVELFGLSKERDRDAFLDLKPLLKHLKEHHHATNVMVEGGASTHAAFMRQGLVDELWVFTGAKLVGDGRGMNPFRLPAPAQGVNEMQWAKSLELMSIESLDGDTFARYLCS